MFDELFGFPMIERKSMKDFRDLERSFFDRPMMQRAKVDIIETEENYEIKMDLPGFKKEDVSVKVNNGVLSIVAEKKETVENEDEKKYIIRERNYSKVSRSFSVDNLKKENVKAAFNNGELTITIKKEEKEKEPISETVEIE